ncbi:MAG: VPLPA-CTERM sorting domain-containing protein [Marinicaulis sp.]|nr:VPLPA-CTERM sorting domain-containing protein [Marinicaulis sp.]
MNTIKVFVASIVAAGAAFVSSASAVPLDFQTLSDGVTTPTFLPGGSVADHTPFLVGAEYAGAGVVFSSEGDTDDELGPVFGTLTGFVAPNIVVQDYKRDLAAGSTFNIRADFAAGTSFVSADVYAAAGNSVTMTAYDSGGGVLGAATSAVIASFGDSEFLTLAGLGTIAYIIWEASSPFSSSVGIDNIDFDAVPIPAALPLLISGLAGLGFASRRKKSA